MARGKYEKKIINTHLETFQQQMERSYSQYQDGAYVPIIYYQLDRDRTRVDQSLDVAQNIIGNSSSRKYKKIVGVPLYGLASGLNYETELTDTAFRTLTASSAYFTPGTITPSADDFFTIDRQGLKNHLFKVTNVDFNTANVNKYHQISFELYQNPSSDITNNIDGEYKFIIENMGSNQNTIIKTADEYLMRVAEDTVDTLIDKYVFSFYDYSYDTFTLNIKSSDFNKAKLWNPYLLRFLHEYNILTKYEMDLMEEIFVPQYNEGGYSNWFKDDVWMDSLYYKIARRLKPENIDLFTTVGYGENLSKWIKLPFYQTSENILLDSFANDYVKNYSQVPINQILNLDDNLKNKLINMKSIFETVSDNEPNVSKNRYLEKKFLYELEYFSANASDIWNNSKIGDIYYVYNKNNGYIDNIYKVDTIVGEVAPGPEDVLLNENRYFKFQFDFKDNNVGRSLFFFENNELDSAWKVLVDNNNNKYIGKLDGNIFQKGNYVIADDSIDFIRDYLNNSDLHVTEEDLNRLSEITVRRDNPIMFYMLPIIIFILKKFVDKIQN